MSDPEDNARTAEPEAHPHLVSARRTYRPDNKDDMRDFAGRILAAFETCDEGVVRTYNRGGKNGPVEVTKAQPYTFEAIFLECGIDYDDWIALEGLPGYSHIIAQAKLAMRKNWINGSAIGDFKEALATQMLEIIAPEVFKHQDKRNEEMTNLLLATMWRNIDENKKKMELEESRREERNAIEAHYREDG